MSIPYLKLLTPTHHLGVEAQTLSPVIPFAVCSQIFQIRLQHFKFRISQLTHSISLNWNVPCHFSAYPITSHSCQLSSGPTFSVKYFLIFFPASEIYAVNFMPVTHQGTFPGGIVLLVAWLVNSLWDSLKSGCISYQLVEQLCSSHLICLSCKFLIYEKNNNHFILGCHIK